MTRLIFKKDQTLGLRTLLLLLCCALFIFAYDRNRLLQRIHEGFSYAVLPIQYSINMPIEFAELSMSYLLSHRTLMQENASLQSRLIQLQAELQKQHAVQSENEHLRALLQSSRKIENKVTVAELLAVNANPFVNQMMINQGNNQKIFIGQPVLDAHGVVGQVVQVNATTSRVMLITDSHSAIPIEVSRNGVRAIATGDPTSRLLKLSYVTETSDIQIGDQLVSSGLGGRYPFGYPVGTVLSIVRRPNSQFADIVVKPAAYLDRSRLFLLLWDQKP